MAEPVCTEQFNQPRHPLHTLQKAFLHSRVPKPLILEIEKTYVEFDARKDIDFLACFPDITCEISIKLFISIGYTDRVNIMNPKYYITLK